MGVGSLDAGHGEAAGSVGEGDEAGQFQFQLLTQSNPRTQGVCLIGHVKGDSRGTRFPTEQLAEDSEDIRLGDDAH